MRKRPAGALAALVALTGVALFGKSALVGVAVLVLAWGLAGHRRLALHLCLGVVVLLGGLTARHHWGRAAVLAAIALVFVLVHDAFPTRPDPARLRTAARAATVLGVLLLIEAGWHVGVQRQHIGTAGRAMAVGFAFNQSGVSRSDHVTAMVLLLGVIVVLVVLFAAAPAPGPGDAAERDRIRVLAGLPGADSLAPFASRSDRTYVFSPDRNAAIAYRVLWGVALAGGDPVGAPASGRAAIDAFLAECERRGWRPAVLGGGAAWLAAWRQAGMRSLPVGDEAVLAMETFSLQSRQMRNVRQAVQRSHNAGVTVQIGPLDQRLAVALEPVLADWLGGRSERGFAMNLDAILEPRPDCLFAVAFDRAGEPVAFARFAICDDGRCLTLDVAPRRRGAPNGVVERLIVDTAQWARERGAREMSLNFAGMRRVIESANPAARTLAVTLHALDRWIEIAPLYRFTRKFRPQWRPRHLLLRSWLQLAVVAAVALRAEFGKAGAAPAEPVAEAAPVLRARPH